MKQGPRSSGGKLPPAKPLQSPRGTQQSPVNPKGTPKGPKV